MGRRGRGTEKVGEGARESRGKAGPLPRRRRRRAAPWVQVAGPAGARGGGRVLGRC